MTDLGFALRTLRARPGHSLLSVLILALGIGAAAAIATIAHTVIFKPLPYAQPERLVFVWDSTKERPVTTLNPGRLVDFRARLRSLDGLAGISHLSVTMTGQRLPEQLAGASVTANFFDVLDVRPALGRVFRSGEPNRELVVLSDALWRRRFDADPAVVGRALTLDGRPHTVVAVMPPQFYWTSITTAPSAGPHPELWVIAPSNDLPGLPIAYEGNLRLDRRTGYLRALGRLQPGVSIQEAQAELTGLARQLAREHPQTDAERGAVLIPARDQLLGHVRLPVLLLLAASALLLAASCANVANLQLMRLLARSRELAVQVALGATGRRLARQLIAESALLTGAAAATGVLVAAAGVRLFEAAVPADVPRLDQLAVSLPMAATAALIALGCGVVVATLPLLRLRRGPGLGTGDRSGTSRLPSGTRRWLVASELATAALLITGALLFGQSLARLQRVDIGISEVDRLLTFHVSLSGPRRSLPPAQRIAFYDAMVERLRAIPGVLHAATAATLPIGGDDFGTSVIAEGGDEEEPRAAGYQVVGPDWFKTLGIPLLTGREFTAADTAESGVVMVNQTFVDQHWHGGDPIGRRLKMGRAAPWRTVIGVVADIRHLGPARPPRPEVYDPQHQVSYAFTAVAVRTAGDPRALAQMVRQEVARLDPAQPISRMATMGEHLRRSQAETRSLGALTATFGSLALVIAALGVYGAIGFSVTQRMREFGVRMALGGTPARIGAQVVRETLVIAAAGVLAGLCVSVMAARAVQSLLFETPAADPTLYAISAAALLATAALAGYLPARAAMRADPAAVLRSE